MLRPIRKGKKRENRFSVNSQNLLYTIFCECTILDDSHAVAGHRQCSGFSDDMLEDAYNYYRAVPGEIRIVHYKICKGCILSSRDEMYHRQKRKD